jgi:hypothetical protein
MTQTPTKKSGVIFWLKIVPFGPLALTAFLYFALFSNDTLPPAWYERHTQRRMAAERVQAAGGWDAIKRDCLRIAEEHPEGFQSLRSTNELPPALVLLSPHEVQYHPADGRVTMRLFGIHSSGGPSTPYFGFEVLTAAKQEGYQPAIARGVIGYQHSNYHELAEGIYEIY